MASLISCASGNFVAAATWALVDPVSLLDSEVANTALTTSYVSSQNFAPGAITIDGIAVKLASRAASPVGTVSVELYNATDLISVPGTEVTLNVSDLPTCSTGADAKEGGWILFKFAAPVLLVAGKNYNVRAKTSDATQVNLYRNGTAGNWSRMLRTTTTQAPVAGDVLHVLGEHTGAGTGNDITVTMNNTNNTQFGSGADGSTALTVCKRGTLSYGVAAATNYYLRLGGNLIVYNGALFNIGTVANAIPRDSTAVLEFNPVADGGMGLIIRNGGTFVAQGLSRTNGKNVVSCKLNTDEPAGQTVLGVDTDTGWLANDEIGIASTTRTAGECEKRTLSINASPTQLTVTVALTNAHSGTAPTQAEVILLTRNVKIRSASSAIMAYVNFKLTALVDIDWVEFYYLGEEATDKRGINVQTTTGSLNIQYSSLHDFEDWGLYVTGSASDNITVSQNVFYNVNSASGNAAIQVIGTTGTSLVFSDNIIIRVAATNAAGFYLTDIGGTFTNNTIVGATDGFHLLEAATAGLFSGNVIHSCSRYGLYFEYAMYSSILSSFSIWRNNNYGIYYYSAPRNLVFNGLTIFGNAIASIAFFASGAAKITFISLVSNGDTSFATPSGIYVTGSVSACDIVLENCDFSTVSGIKTAHTQDIYIAAPNSYVTLVARNTKFGAPTEVSGQATLLPGSYIKSQKHNQTAGLHKSFFRCGNIDIDNIYFRTAAPSQRLSPNNASEKLESGSKKAAVNNGGAAAFTVWVRKSSVAAGGADYNGNQPRLVLKKNVAAGIASDTVLDTMTLGLNAWEQLTGITPAVTDDAVLEVVVDCDGTAGFINIDEWSVG